MKIIIGIFILVSAVWVCPQDTLSFFRTKKTLKDSVSIYDTVFYKGALQDTAATVILTVLMG